MDGVIVNEEKPTRLTNNDRISIIDLGICSSNVAYKIQSITLEDTYGSDHFPLIHYVQGIGVVNRGAEVQVGKVGKQVVNIDWGKFKDLADGIEGNTYEEVKNKLTQYLKYAENSNYKGTSRIPCIWWDLECSEAVSRRRRMIKLFKVSGLLEDYIKAKREIARCKRFLKKKKRNKFREMCESWDGTTASSEMWKKFKAFSNANNKEIHSNYVKANKILCEEMLYKISPDFVRGKPINVELDQSTERVWTDQFKEEELIRVINNRTNSSPGMDNFSYKMLKNLNIKTIRLILDKFNDCWNKGGKIPLHWREFLICLVPKQGRNKNLLEGFRPIALSSCIRKCFEYIILSRLEWWIESNNKLHKFQIGFRKNLSCMDGISKLYLDILNGFARGQVTLAVFLDIEAAYDKVLPQLLVERLEALGVPQKVRNLIFNLIDDRIIYVKHEGGAIGPRRTSVGLPQGSVLSPILFNIYCTDLEEVIAGDCNIIQYADDICLYVTSRNVSNAEIILNRTLKGLNQWCFYKGFNLTPQKSKAILFSKNKKLITPNIYIEKNKIPIVKQHKFLGVIFDTKLSWTNHIKELVAKCNQNLNILKAFAGVSWGSNYKVLSMFYKNIIRLKLDYGCFLLNGSKTLMSRLDHIQYNALRIISGAMRSSPVHALQFEMKELPLHLRRKMLGMRFCLKQWGKNSEIININLNGVLETIREGSPFWWNRTCPILICAYEKIKDLEENLYKEERHSLFKLPFDNLLGKIQIILDLGMDSEEFKHMSKNIINNIFKNRVGARWPGFDEIYTDGSVNTQSNLAGFGVFIPGSNFEVYIRMPKFSNIFSAELMAIYEAIKIVIEKKLNRSIIFTDSKSVLLAARNRSFKSHPFLHRIGQKIQDAKILGLEIILCWIPGHMGISGNEKVDMLAKQAVNENVALRTTGKIIFKDLYPYVNKYIYREWNAWWKINCKMKGKHYGKILSSIFSKNWYEVFRNLERQTFTTMVRLRLGHGRTPKFMYKLKLAENDICSCGEIGTLDHIVLGCINIKNQVDNLYLDLENLNIIGPFSVISLLATLQISNYNILIKFIKSSNLKL